MTMLPDKNNDDIKALLINKSLDVLLAYPICLQYVDDNVTILYN